MDEVIENLDQLEQQRATKHEQQGELEYEEVENEELEQLETASDVLKKTALLLEWISNPDFCKSITKSLRATIDRQVERINEIADQLDATIEEQQDDAEEEEDE